MSADVPQFKIRREWLPLNQALLGAGRECRWGPAMDPHAVRVLEAGVVPQLRQEMLEIYGVSRFRFRDGGASAVVFDMTGGTVLRLSPGGLPFRADCPHLLKATGRGEMNGIGWEVLPTADTANITEADMARMDDLLEGSAWEFVDRGTDQLGYVDGRLVILDPGAVCRAPDLALSRHAP